MLGIGLILIVLGVVALLAGIFYTDDPGESAELLGMPLGTTTIFIVGVLSGLAILWGFGLLKYGTRRGFKRRREQKQLSELSQKLERVEAERARERSDEDRPGL